MSDSKLTPDQQAALRAWGNALSVAREVWPDGAYPAQVTWMHQLGTFKLLNDPLEARLIYEQSARESLELWTRFYGPVGDGHEFFYTPHDREEGS